MKSLYQSLLISVVALGILGMASTANFTESGWEYSRVVDEFSDKVTHHASNQYLKNGELFQILVSCFNDQNKNEGIVVGFVSPGRTKVTKISTVGDGQSATIVTVHVRVDKRPQQTFHAVATGEHASISIDWLNQSGKESEFVRGLMRGSELIFRVEDSDTASFSLVGSAGPIGKVLNTCIT